MVAMLQHDTDALSFAVASGIWRVLNILPGEQLPEQPSAQDMEQLRAFLARQLSRAANDLYATNHHNVVRLNGEIDQSNLLRAAYACARSNVIRELDRGSGESEGVEHYERNGALNKPARLSLLPPLDTTRQSALVDALAVMVAALEAGKWNRFDSLASEFCAAIYAQCIYRRMELPDLADHIHRILDVRQGDTHTRPSKAALIVLEFLVGNQLALEGYVLLEHAKRDREKAEFAKMGACVAALFPPRAASKIEANFPAALRGVLQDVGDEAKLDSSTLSLLTALLEHLRRAIDGDQTAWLEFNNELRLLTMRR